MNCLSAKILGVCCVLFPLLQNHADETEILPTPEPGENIIIGADERLNLELVWIEALGMWVGKYEVTNAQYKMYDTNHKSEPFYKKRIDMDSQPAVNVSWYDVNNFAGWLNRRFSDYIPPGYEFRLPSESEWETFAACGEERKYPWGDDWPPPETLNYRGEEGSGFLFRTFEHNDIIKGYQNGFVVSAPVTESGENEWGLFGVGGNAWEWCLDYYSREYDERVLKGGAWNVYWPENMEISARAGTPAAWKNAMIGFRLVLAPKVSGNTDS